MIIPGVDEDQFAPGRTFSSFPRVGGLRKINLSFSSFFNALFPEVLAASISLSKSAILGRPIRLLGPTNTFLAAERSMS